MPSRANTLAVNGGEPVRASLLPYGRQSVDEEDIAAVVEVLSSDWLTTGPKVAEFERVFADTVGAREAVAVSSGTAALHAAMHALAIGPGDEVIVPAITFAATANCVVYQGGRPVFADVQPDTLLIDPVDVEQRLTRRSKAIVAVDYAGQPCDYDSLRRIAEKNNLALVADSCHSLGATYNGEPVGSLADINVFSFHPVKHITTAEGGMVTTGNPELARRVRTFRNHGITMDHRARSSAGSWSYEMTELGFNYRLSDIQCALGLSQLRKLDAWVKRRQAIGQEYDKALAKLDTVYPLSTRSHLTHAYHLYVVLLDLAKLLVDRDAVFRALRAEGIGVNVHYSPVHLHPFYRRCFETRPGLCPTAEMISSRFLTLPLFPQMSQADVDDVVAALYKVLTHYRVNIEN